MYYTLKKLSLTFMLVTVFGFQILVADMLLYYNTAILSSILYKNSLPTPFDVFKGKNFYIEDPINCYDKFNINMNGDLTEHEICVDENGIETSNEIYRDVTFTVTDDGRFFFSEPGYSVHLTIVSQEINQWHVLTEINDAGTQYNINEIWYLYKPNFYPVNY